MAPEALVPAEPLQSWLRAPQKNSKKKFKKAIDLPGPLPILSLPPTTGRVGLISNEPPKRSGTAAKQTQPSRVRIEYAF
jgi:hypothetical protein